MSEHSSMLSDENGKSGTTLKFLAGEKKTIWVWLRNENGTPKTFPLGVSEVVVKIPKKTEGQFLTKKLSLSEIFTITYSYGYFFFILSPAESLDLKDFDPNSKKVSFSVKFQSMSGPNVIAEEIFNFKDAFEISSPSVDLTA